MSSERLTRGSTGEAIYLGVPLPPGPWHTEPDHEEFRSPEGFACIVHRNNLGAWCGYVGVPPGHPWHGKEYGDEAIDADVHGGLTYADRCQGPICHVARPGESDDVWWLGFDCIHAGDLSLSDIARGDRDAHGEPWPCSSYRTIGYARAETLSLAEQVSKAVR